jgi:hypothetical protein
MDGVHHGPRRRSRWSTAVLGLLVGLLVLLSGLVVRSYLIPSPDDSPVPDAATPRGGPLPLHRGRRRSPPFRPRFSRRPARVLARSVTSNDG